MASTCGGTSVDGAPEQLKENEGGHKDQKLAGLRCRGFDELREQRAKEQKSLRVACADQHATSEQCPGANFRSTRIGNCQG